jgi:hypothetical protein
MKHASGPVEHVLAVAEPEGAGGGSAPAEAATVGAGVGSGDADPVARVVVTGLAPRAVMERLSKRAKMGKLAGFAAEPGGMSFTILVSGGIYDHVLRGRVAAEGTGSRLTFELEILKKMPIAAVAVVVLTFFPGLYLTDSMLTTYFEWYRIETWWWYVPLGLLMIPVLWKQYRVGSAVARVDAGELIGVVAREVEGR